MNNYFTGKKTITAGILAILAGATAYFSGEATTANAILIGLNGLIAIAVKMMNAAPVAPTTEA